MDAPEDQAPDRVGEAAGDRAEPIEGGPPAGSCRPRARSRSRRGRAPAGTAIMLVTRCARSAVEQDPRVAAPDVEDVGADAQRVDQPDRLLEQVAERQDADDPVLDRRQHAVDRAHRREQVVVGDHHALRRAGRARGEDQVPDVLGAGRGHAATCAATSPAGLHASSGSATRSATVVVGKSARPGAGRDPARRGRCRGSAGAARRWRRCPGSRRGSSGGRAGRGSARPHRPDVDRRRGPARTGSRSGSDRPARGRAARADATRRAGCADRARGRSTSSSTPSSCQSDRAGRSANRRKASSSRSRRVAGAGTKRW